MLKNRATVLIALPLLVVALAGCSSEGGGASPTAKSQSQLAADAKTWDVALATCLRAEGIDFADPTASGGGAIDVGDDFDIDAFQAAAGTCKDEVTAKLGDRPVTAAEEKEQAEFEEQLRETNACLREKGYDAPDPREAEDGVVISEAPDSDIPDEVLEACGGSVGAGSTGRG